MSPPRFVHFPIEPVQSFPQSAQLVDDPQMHRLLTVDHAAHIRRHVILCQHEGLKLLRRDPAVSRHKGHDPLLKPLKIVVGLGRGDDRSAHPHGMDGHGGGGHRKAPLGRHRQWDANGMAAP